MAWLLSLPWGLLIVACLTLGLAPFAPPHVVEKLQMLASGTLVRPLDWFDLALHASPWLLLLAKIFAVTWTAIAGGGAPQPG